MGASDLIPKYKMSSEIRSRFSSTPDYVAASRHMNP
jgi:hypothetical protein